MVFKYPLTEPLFVFVQWQIPVFCFAQHRFRTRNSRFWLNQVERTQARTASFALVAVCVRVFTVRASTCNIAVSQELTSLFIIILFRSFLYKLTFFIQILEVLSRSFIVNFRSRTRVNIKRNTQLLKRFFDNAMIAVNNILRRNTLFFSFNCDRHPVLIRATNKQHLFTLQSQISNINICWNIHTCQVTNMHRTICIRQSRSNQRTFKIFHIFLLIF